MSWVNAEIHILISDPFKVLFGHRNENEVYSVYVTDYTPNSQLYPVQATWCPPELSNRVLKIEMWPPANDFATSMTQGEFYSIRNNRMKVSNGGYVEASFSEVHKLRKLDETDTENEPHLQALLQYGLKFLSWSLS